MMADAPFRILIADDNVQNLELLDAYLAELNCSVTTAADGAETLARALEAPPDLIVLDVMMPRLSGFEVCQRLRADPRTAGIPVLMVTALHDKADIDRGVEVGADDFLSKPILKDELLRRVRALLAVRRISAPLERAFAYQREVESAGS
jgi:CheY-like chemotaxis protein